MQYYQCALLALDYWTVETVTLTKESVGNSLKLIDGIVDADEW